MCALIYKKNTYIAVLVQKSNCSHHVYLFQAEEKLLLPKR